MMVLNEVVCAEYREADPNDPDKLRASLTREKVGWCATRKKTTDYQDYIRTLCGQAIHFTGGVAVREPTCPQCRAVLGLA